MDWKWCVPVRENCKQSCSSVIEIYHQPEDYQRRLMETYPDYSSEEYLDGWGWQEDQLVPVPGFGFFPSQMKEELEEEAQVVFINLPCHHFLPFTHQLFVANFQSLIVLLQAFLREVSLTKCKCQHRLEDSSQDFIIAVQKIANFMAGHQPVLELHRIWNESIGSF